MEEVYRFQWAVDECIVFLREHATNGEELMVLRVIEWLAAAQRNDTGRIQRAIWTIDPDRFRREMREGHTHGSSGQAIQVLIVVPTLVVMLAAMSVATELFCWSRI
ncbi:hypothetical protein QL093DRAFT_2095202 [Fusarium oxysporum]|nr:hypothetical protein QL093DRAFT_2095202 [Fusarium oxysporum]